MIVIEGVMGTGKTTLQNKLVEKLNGVAIVQDFEHNICLKDYYDTGYYALQKQMIFLFSNYHILYRAQETLNSLLVADFSFERSLIMSQEVLTKEEYEDVFCPCYDYLIQSLKPPEVIVFLHGNPDTIIANIRKRNREIEKDIDIEYIERIQTSFLNHIGEFKCSRLITIDIDEDDILSDSLVNKTINEIKF